MALYLGIDFGTSTLYVTRWNMSKQQVEPVANLGELNQHFIENAIYYESPTNFVVGELALKKGITNPANCVRNIKRSLDDPNWQQFIPALNREIDSGQVVRDVFSWLKNKIESQSGGEKIAGVVISVPFAFKQQERQLLKQSAETVGLPVMHLIEEPVAAAFSYSLKIKNPEIALATSQCFLVFDLGETKLDITIFKLSFIHGKLLLDVLNTNEHPTLGSINIDHILVDRFKDVLPDTWHQIPEKERQEDLFKLYTEAKNLKEILSESDSEDVIITQLKNNHCVEIDDVTSERFGEWVCATDFLDDIKQTLQQSLDEIRLTPEAIDKIILVGGSCHIPLIMETVTAFFGKEPESVSEEAVTLVGEGAGLYAGKLLSNSLDYEVIMRSSFAVGILNKPDQFIPLIKRNQRYGEPSAPKLFTFKPKQSGKKTMVIRIYQGDVAQPKTWQCIGRAIIPYALFPDHKLSIQLVAAEESGIIKYNILNSNGELKKAGEVRYE